MEKKQKENQELELELEKLTKEIIELTKEVVKDYEEIPSELSGSMIMFHENSPYLKEGEISGSTNRSTDTHKT